ncbi:non-structural maintenance of chromosomes element 4 homolog A [Scaptodrosophila lebanonensis]|uniref:Non-structural maintenance of chromosomes element 4 n=1 Tax=Drosophila lebanonensis TaxID=7225 RepID=A0A6J2TAV1_DROLE|nr:non-structural maintenance of chromosomes element 4 homolog A [Scaptodrosophila lebanonensis]
MASFSTQNESIPTMTPDEIAQEERIIKLHDLIEQNIIIEQEVEGKPFEDSVTAIENIIRKANTIVKGYEQRQTNSLELVLDTELLRRNHEVIGKAIQCSSTITDTMFCKAISDVVCDADGTEDWDKLCGIALKYGRSLFTNTSILPFIDVKPKEHIPKQRSQRPKKTNVEEKRPSTSHKLERKDEGSAVVSNIHKEIKMIYKAGNCQPIPFFKLIIDPDNFMNTVHNALNVSFLVRENVISISKGVDGLPQVGVVTNPTEIADNEPLQNICRIDAKLWQRFIKHYNIKKPMLTSFKNAES